MDVVNRKLGSLVFHSRDGLFYLSCLLITFNSFPFDRYGLGSGKSLAIYFLLLYVVKIFLEKRFVISKNTRLQMLFIGLLLLGSFYAGSFLYHDYIGFSASIGMWSAYFIYTISVASFIENADDQKIFNMCKCVFYSFWFSLIFGLLEYLYLEKGISQIYSIIVPFLRDEAFLNSNRIQLNFGEAGDAGQIIPGLLFPIILLLKKYGYKFSVYEKGMVLGLLVLMTLYSQSASFVIVGVLTCLFYFDSYLRKFRLYATIKWILLIILLFLGSAFIVGSLSYLSGADNSIGRVFRLLTNPQDAFADDLSSAARIGMFSICYEMFKDNYIWGTGLGYMGFSFGNYLTRIPEYFLTPEIQQLSCDKMVNSYSIITNILLEGGLLGIMWVLAYLRPIYDNFFNYIKARPFIIAFLIISLQQMLIYSFPFCFIYLLFSNPKFCNYFNKD